MPVTSFLARKTFFLILEVKATGLSAVGAEGARGFR